MNERINPTKLFALFLAFTLASFSSAIASKNISSPYVEEGEVELELKTEYHFDGNDSKDGKNSQQTAVAYTPNSWWKFEIGAQLEKEPGERQNASEVFFENYVQFTERGEYWLNAGAEIEYAVADDHPDELEAKLLLSKDFDLFEITSNISAGREIGAGSSNDIEWEVATGIEYRYTKLLGFGVEVYNEFGNFSDGFDEQEHYAGPVSIGKWYGFKYDVGYLFGVSDASSDGILKANFEIEF